MRGVVATEARRTVKHLHAVMLALVLALSACQEYEPLEVESCSDPLARRAPDAPAWRELERALYGDASSLCGDSRIRWRARIRSGGQQVNDTVAFEFRLLQAAGAKHVMRWRVLILDSRWNVQASDSGEFSIAPGFAWRLHRAMLRTRPVRQDGAVISCVHCESITIAMRRDSVILRNYPVPLEVSDAASQMLSELRDRVRAVLRRRAQDDIL
jgi:hypothetical protein